VKTWRSVCSRIGSDITKKEKVLFLLKGIFGVYVCCAVCMRPDLYTLLYLRCIMFNYHEFVICDIFYIQPYGERIGSMK
jgi:hypothetical protein